MGWLEQYHLNGPSLRYEFDLAALFAKGMNDMADSQQANGFVPNIAPEYVKFAGGFRDSPEWGSSFILVPWQQYEFHGDVALLGRHYEAMRRYAAYLGSRAKVYVIDYGLGDWYDIGPRPPGESQLTPKALTATAIYYEDVLVMAKVARVLGKTADAEEYDKLAGEIRAAFNRKFFNPAASRYATGSQTANAMPLVLGIVDPSQRQAVLEAIVADVHGKGLTAGDVGYRYLLRALASNGRSDVVFAMNNQLDKPGYGYQLRQGATSLTEAWDARRRLVAGPLHARADRGVVLPRSGRHPVRSGRPGVQEDHYRACRRGRPGVGQGAPRLSLWPDREQLESRRQRGHAGRGHSGEHDGHGARSRQGGRRA